MKNQLLGSNAFDPKFWKYGKGKVQPNASLLMPTQQARAIATNIHSAIAGYWKLQDDEDKIISEFKNYNQKDKYHKLVRLLLTHLLIMVI